MSRLFDLNPDTPSSTPGEPSTLRRRTVLAAAASALLAPWSTHALADLAQVRERGSLKIALYRANLPFSDGNAQGAVGAEADLAKALAAKLKLGVQWLVFEAGENMGDDLRNLVWKGHYLGFGPADVMMQVPIDKYLISQTPQVEFLMPYYRHRLVWLSKGTPSAQALRDMELDGLTLAVEISTAAGGALLGHGDGKYRQAVKLLPTGLEAAKGVVEGRWQAAYVTQAQAEAALKGVPDRDRYVIEPATLRGTPVGGWPVGMAIKSGQPELSKALSAALKELTDDGTLATIWRSHGLTLLAP